MLSERRTDIPWLAFEFLDSRGGGHVRLAFAGPSLMCDRYTVTLTGRMREATVDIDRDRLLMGDAVGAALDAVRYAWLLLNEAPLPAFRIWRRSPRHLQARRKS